MYSVVLMVAMAGGGDAIDLGRHRGGGGCCGGGYGYSGCCGGGCYGGGCYGGGWSYSCSGGCYGGYGGWSGCCGGGRVYGGGGYGGYAYGSNYAPAYYAGSNYAPVYYGGTAYPGVGTWQSGYYDPSVSYPGGIRIIREGDAERRDEKKEERKEGVPPPKPEEGAAAPAPATILVSLPADAKVMIDDQATRSTSAERRFVTPPLPAGKEFHYTLTAVVDRDGQPAKASQEVTVRAGQESRVALDLKDFKGAAK
jgi:uncharacterized protein (TIGR03000 family)